MSKKVFYDEAVAKQKSRRHFLGALLAAATLGLLSQKDGPVERPLHEANFYKPHNLAG